MADKTLLISHLEASGGGWYSLKDIKTALPAIADRTLRRWLSDLVQEGLVQRGGQRKGARYRWSHASPVETETIFTSASQRHLQRVEAPLYTRSPVTYSENWVDSYIPNRTFYLSEAQRQQLQLRGKRPSIHGRVGTYIQKIYNRLLIDLSYNSSRLEGNTYTLADTERLVIKGIGAEGKLKEEQVMILNHKEAIRYLAQDSARLMLNEETIRTLHYLLADGLVAPELAGQIRDESVLISGTTYAPLEGRERLSHLLRELLEKSHTIENPFEQSFFLLGHLSYLQAFVDVNKRLARLASIVPLIKNDYVPQSFVDADKDDYLKALICFYEFNETAPLADLYYWSYLRTCQHYDTSIQVFGFDEVAVLYRAQRRTLVSNIIRSMTPLGEASSYIDAHLPQDVKAEHRVKFIEDVMAELNNLDIARIAGMGIDQRQLQRWLHANKL